MCFRDVGDELACLRDHYLGEPLVSLIVVIANVSVDLNMMFQAFSKKAEADLGFLSDLHPCHRWT